MTNDDGVDQPGLRVLAERLVADHGDDVWVVAPAWEHSGAGAAVGHLTAVTPTLRKVDVPGVADGQAWSVDGPPALAVLLCRLGVIGDPPDIVVSGINPGFNVGRAVYHSGTIGAALTARTGGASGIAVSQRFTMPELHPTHWETAADIAADALNALIATPPAETGVLNINVPDLPAASVRGARLCEVDSDIGPTALVATPAEQDDGSLRISFSYDPSRMTAAAPGTDIAAVYDDEVAISWLGRIGLSDPGDPGVADSVIAGVRDRMTGTGEA